MPGSMETGLETESVMAGQVGTCVYWGWSGARFHDTVGAHFTLLPPCESYLSMLHCSGLQEQ